MKEQYTVSIDELPSISELTQLLTQANWARERSYTDIGKLLKNIDIFVIVREENKLVGFGRALSDGIFRALIDDIIVDQNHRGRGIGKIIMKELMEQLVDIEEIFLNTGHHLTSYYEKYGFIKSDGITMKVKQK